MTDHVWALIMAGGSGERLWPLSRRRHPKQTLRLGYKQSLLQVTAKRLRAVVPTQRTVVVTTQNQADLVRRQLPSIRPEHFWVEPASRNTAAAIGLGTIAILEEDPDAVVVVAPADHVIQPVEKFHHTILKAVALAKDREGLVCLGVKPTYPATGFGYIEPMGKPIPPGGYRVKRFLEKPDLKTAKRLLRNPNMVWNAGIFCWKGRVILGAIRQWLPRLAKGLEAIRKVLGTPEGNRWLQALYRQLPSISIDVGVLERSRHVWVVPTDFQWDDVGSWNSLAFLHSADAMGNVVLGSHLGIETTGSIIVGTDAHLIATLGVKDLVVVHTPDATLVCHKSQAQDVRRLVARLASSPRWRKLL
jgi:mannose-1-phosphate guanylyltransferase